MDKKRTKKTSMARELLSSWQTHFAQTLQKITTQRITAVHSHRKASAASCQSLSRLKVRRVCHQISIGVGAGATKLRTSSRISSKHTIYTCSERHHARESPVRYSTDKK